MVLVSINEGGLVWFFLVCRGARSRHAIDYGRLYIYVARLSLNKNLLVQMIIGSDSITSNLVST